MQVAPPARLRRLRRALRRESGFTLIELLLATSMLLIILGAALYPFNAVQRHSTRDIERTQTISLLRADLERMTRELRMGEPTSANTCGTSSGGLPTTPGSCMDVVVGGYRVRYDCTVVDPNNSAYHRCVRYWSSTDLTDSPTGNATVVIDQLGNDETSTDSAYTPVFTPNSTTAPTYYSVTVEVPARGQQNSGYQYQATVTDGIFMRNACQSNRTTCGE